MPTPMATWLAGTACAQWSWCRRDSCGSSTRGVRARLIRPVAEEVAGPCCWGFSAAGRRSVPGWVGVRGELVLDELLESLVSSAVALAGVAEHREGLDDLVAQLIRHADGRGLDHLVVGHQHAFDIEGRSGNRP